MKYSEYTFIKNYWEFDIYYQQPEYLILFDRGNNFIRREINYLAFKLKQNNNYIL